MMVKVEGDEKGKMWKWITMDQFVHLATSFGAHGLRDAQVLVLTHRTFCESKELLKALRTRFWMPIPPNLTPSEITNFKVKRIVFEIGPKSSDTFRRRTSRRSEVKSSRF